MLFPALAKVKQGRSKARPRGDEQHRHRHQAATRPTTWPVSARRHADRTQRCDLWLFRLRTRQPTARPSATNSASSPSSWPWRIHGQRDGHAEQGTCVQSAAALPLLNAKITSDTNAAGVGPDGEYRDPWGVPYVISLDTSLNERCRDEVYSRAERFPRTAPDGSLTVCSIPHRAAPPMTSSITGQFMIWSLRAGQAIRSTTVKANQGVNKDNVLSWQ